MARGRTRRPLSEEEYVAGVLAGELAVLGRAVTLVESTRPAHQTLADRVLTRLLPHTGKAYRVGISGVPGVGKSTFIERLGLALCAAGHRVAVLAIDPTSRITGGSILGDKTRMSRLSRDPRCFIRPSPSSGTLGGVARKTRESMLVCEAAGFDVVLVETVGVGQSETVVADMVDFFLVLMLAGAGDELQGIKRGILELADMLAINKADGDNAAAAERARRDYATALHYLQPVTPGWRPPVLTCSGLTGAGIPALWAEIERHRAILESSGELARKRRAQLVRWMWSLVEEQLIDALRHHPRVATQLAAAEEAVASGQQTAACAARTLLAAFHDR
jgi:LAO/AO transport system kinase